MHAIHAELPPVDEQVSWRLAEQLADAATSAETVAEAAAACAREARWNAIMSAVTLAGVADASRARFRFYDGWRYVYDPRETDPAGLPHMVVVGGQADRAPEGMVDGFGPFEQIGSWEMVLEVGNMTVFRQVAEGA